MRGRRPAVSAVAAAGLVLVIVAGAAIGAAYYAGVIPGQAKSSSTSSTSSSLSTTLQTSSSISSPASTSTTVHSSAASSIVSNALSITVDNVYVGRVNVSTYRYLFNLSLSDMAYASGLLLVAPAAQNFTLVSTGGKVFPADLSQGHTSGSGVINEGSSGQWRVAFNTPQQITPKEIQFQCAPSSCSRDNNTYVASTTSFPAVIPLIFFYPYGIDDASGSYYPTLSEIASSTYTTDHYYFIFSGGGFSGDGNSSVAGEMVFMGNETGQFMLTIEGSGTCAGQCNSGVVNFLGLVLPPGGTTTGNLPSAGGCLVFFPKQYTISITMPNIVFGSAQDPAPLGFSAQVSYFANESCTG